MYVFINRIIPESPRWLMMNGKYEESFEILHNMAKSNDKTLPPKDVMLAILKTLHQQVSITIPTVSMKY